VESGTNRNQKDLTDLIELAYRLGASDATIISAAEISVEDDLAKLCFDPPCESYGLSAGCPPHVEGASAFRELLKGYERALVFRIEVPSQILLSNERQEIFRLLHQIAADVEQAAVRKGYWRSRGYAGGSCKRLFCGDERGCRVVSEGGACRNPERARPSMSGFGVNVSKLMEAAGWEMNRIRGETGQAAPSGAGTVCGLVLIE
jgi:predicted metal-binding protein